MNADEINFALAAYDSLAGDPDNLFTKSNFVRGIILAGFDSKLMEKYLEPDPYHENANKPASPLVGMFEDLPADRRVAILQKDSADFVSHSHHYGPPSGADNFIYTPSTGSLTVSMNWLEPSLTTGYVFNTRTTVLFKRGPDQSTATAKEESKSRTTVTLEFETGLCASNISVKLHEYYDQSSQNEIVDVYSGERLPGPPNRIDVVFEDRVLFQLDFSTVGTVPELAATSGRVGLAILEATKVLGYLSVLRVCDAAYFSLLASTGATKFNLENLTVFVDSINKISDRVKTDSKNGIMHLDLKYDENLRVSPHHYANLEIGVRMYAIPVSKRRLGEFYDIISASRELSANLIDVLLRIRSGDVVPRSSDAKSKLLVAEWLGDIQESLGMDRNVENANVGGIRKAFDDFVSDVKNKLEDNDAAAADKSFHIIYEAGRDVVNKYPATLEPTEFAEEVYKIAKKAYAQCIDLLVDWGGDNLVKTLKNCVPDHSDLQVLVDELEQRDLKSSVKLRATLLYVISMSHAYQIKTANADLIYVVLDDAKSCISEGIKTNVFATFSEFINDDLLWRTSMRSDKFEGLRNDVLANVETVVNQLTVKILRNTSLARYLSQLLRKALDATKKFADELASAENAAQDAKDVQKKVDRILPTAKKTPEASISAADNLVIRGQLVTLNEDYSVVSLNQFIKVRRTLEMALEFSDTLRILYTDGEGKAREKLRGLVVINPEDQANLAKAVVSANTVLATTALTVARDLMRKAETEATEAGASFDVKVVTSEALNAFVNVQTEPDKVVWIEQVERSLNKLRQVFQIETVRKSETAQSSGADIDAYIKALHMLTATAYVVDAYATFVSLFPDIPPPMKIDDVREQLRQAEIGLADRVAALFEKSFEIGAVSSPAIIEYRDYLGKARANNTLGESVPIPADDVLDDLIKRGFNLADVKEYKKLQDAYFASAVRKRQRLPEGLEILRRTNPLSPDQRSNILLAIAAAFGSLDSVVLTLGTLQGGDDASRLLRNVGLEGVKLLQLAYINVDAEQIIDRVLKKHFTDAQVNLQGKPVLSVENIDDVARKSLLREMLNATREFFSHVEALGKLPANENVAAAYRDVERIEQTCISLLKTMFEFTDVTPAPAQPRKPNIDAREDLRDALTQADNLTQDARSNFSAFQTMMDVATKLPPAQLNQLEQDVETSFKDITKISVALALIETRYRQIVDPSSAGQYFEDPLRDSLKLADLKTMYERGLKFLDEYDLFSDAIKPYIINPGELKAAALSTIESYRSSTINAFRLAKTVADRHSGWTQFAAFVRWGQIRSAMDRAYDSLVANVGAAQKSLIEVDLAAFRANMLKEFSEQATTVATRLKETLTEIQTTTKKAQEETKDFDKIYKKLTTLADIVRKLGEEPLTLEGGRSVSLAELEATVESVGDLMKAQGSSLETLETDTKALKKRVEEARKIIADAKLFIAAGDVAKQQKAVDAEIAKLGAKENDILRLKTIVDRADAQFSAHAKALKSTEEKEREVKNFLEQYKKDEQKRQTELKEITDAQAQLEAIVSGLRTTRTTISNNMRNLGGKIVELKRENTKQEQELKTQKSDLEKNEQVHERLNRQYDELKSSQLKLTTKAADLKSKVDALGAERDSQLADLLTKATTAESTASGIAAAINVLKATAESAKTHAENDAKEIERSKKDIEDQKKKLVDAEKSLRATSDVILLERLREPYSQLKSLTALMTRLEEVIRNFTVSLVGARAASQAAVAAAAAGGPGPGPGPGPSGQGPSGQGPSGQGPSGQGPSGQGPSGQGPSGQGPSGQGPSGQSGRPGSGPSGGGGQEGGSTSSGGSGTGGLPPRPKAPERPPGQQPTVDDLAALADRVVNNLLTLSYSLGENIEFARKKLAGIKKEEIQEQLIKLEKQAVISERDQLAYENLLKDAVKKIETVRTSNKNLITGRDTARAQYQQLVEETTNVALALTALNSDIGQADQAVKTTVAQIEGKKNAAQALLTSTTANVKAIENKKTLLITATTQLQEAMESTEVLNNAADKKVADLEGAKTTLVDTSALFRREVEKIKAEIAAVEVPQLLGPNSLEGVVEAKKAEITAQATTALAGAIRDIRAITSAEVVASATKDVIVPLLTQNRDQVVAEVTRQITESATSANDFINARIQEASAGIAGVPAPVLQAIDNAKNVAVQEVQTKLLEANQTIADLQKTQQNVIQALNASQTNIQDSVNQRIQAIAGSVAAIEAKATEDLNKRKADFDSRVLAVTADVEQKLLANALRIEGGGIEHAQENRLISILQDEIAEASRDVKSQYFEDLFKELIDDSKSATPVFDNWFVMQMKNIWVSIENILEYVTKNIEPNTRENQQQLIAIGEIRKEVALVSNYTPRQKMFQFVLFEIPDRIYGYQAIALQYLAVKDTGDPLRNQAKAQIVENVRGVVTNMLDARTMLLNVRVRIVLQNGTFTAEDASAIQSFYNFARQFSDDLLFAYQLGIGTYEVEGGEKQFTQVDFGFFSQIVATRDRIANQLKLFEVLSERKIRAANLAAGQISDVSNRFITWHAPGQAAAQIEAEKSLISFYGNLYLLAKYVLDVYQARFFRASEAADVELYGYGQEFQQTIRLTVAQLENWVIDKPDYLRELLDMYAKMEILMGLFIQNMSDRAEVRKRLARSEGKPESPIVDEPEESTSSTSSTAAKKPKVQTKDTTKSESSMTATLTRMRGGTRGRGARGRLTSNRKMGELFVGSESIDEDELRLVFDRAMTMYLAERRVSKTQDDNDDDGEEK